MCHWCTLHSTRSNELLNHRLKKSTSPTSLLLSSRGSGLRDDLNFLLEEDLCNVNLCSLHCEMRNCEQLLGSLGLFAHRIGSLDKLNEALSNYGPENCRGFPRVTVKERKGQQTSIERANIHVASFSGIVQNKIQYK